MNKRGKERGGHAIDETEDTLNNFVILPSLVGFGRNRYLSFVKFKINLNSEIGFSYQPVNNSVYRLVKNYRVYRVVHIFW